MIKRSHHFNGKNFSLGPFVKCPHPEMIESIALAGFDFAVVDMEHTPVGPSQLLPLQLACEARGIEMVLRIPANKEEYFKWALDQGINNLQVPHIQNTSGASQAKEWSHFAPDGQRGLCRFVRSAEYSAKDKAEYIAQTKPNLIFQIEGQEGVENIQEILTATPPSVLFIGPYDLSQSLGCPGDIWDEKVVSKMKEIIASCKEKSINVGVFTDTPEGIRTWAELGVDMIQYASDLNLFQGASLQLRADFSK